MTATGSLLVVSGPPGAGKSTVSRLLADRLERSVLVAGDAFFAFLAAGAIQPWLPESHAQNQVVTRVAAVATAEFVRGGYDVVYDGVMGPWFLDEFAEAMGLDTFDVAIVLPSVAECVRRVATRRGHGFTDPAATRSMHAQFESDAIDERHVIRDDTSDPAAIADEIARRRGTGALRVTAGLATPAP